MVHFTDWYHGVDREQDSAEVALRNLEELVMLEGPQTIAAIIVESVTGTNGVLIPPNGYMQGVRALCDKHGIVMIADEVMAGFGRTGEWFAVNHWKVVPDIMTMAKGITSSYVPLGAVGMRRRSAISFRTRCFRRSHLQQHALAWRRALATIAVYEEDDLIQPRKADRQGDGGTDVGPGEAPPVGRRGTISSAVLACIELIRNRRRSSRWRHSTARLRKWRRSASSSVRRALHIRAVELLLHEPAAHHHRGAAPRGTSASSIAGWRLPTRRSS
jgi:taurine--2-oxoglutarate transaminase